MCAELRHCQRWVRNRASLSRRVLDVKPTGTGGAQILQILLQNLQNNTTLTYLLDTGLKLVRPAPMKLRPYGAREIQLYWHQRADERHGNPPPR